MRCRPPLSYAALLAGGCLLLSSGCTLPSEDPCADPEAALATCVEPTFPAEYYVEQSQLYFNTMDANENRDLGPAYSELVARWEWPPWLKLTAFGRADIVESDLLLRLYPSIIPERECRFFPQQPFGRCRVVFYYDDHEGRGCPIYEEFTFNEAGEMTFIEAWSDLPGYLPMPEDDTWAEGEAVTRLSTRVPGLGAPDGRVSLGSDAMRLAGETDPDVADFAYRAADWRAAWLDALDEAGGTLWAEGCGWP